MDPLLLSDAEACKVLGISRSKFYLLVADGAIPRLKLGRTARYRAGDILQFVERLAAEAHGGTSLARGAVPPTPIDSRTD